MVQFSGGILWIPVSNTLRVYVNTAVYGSVLVPTTVHFLQKHGHIFRAWLGSFAAKNLSTLDAKGISLSDIVAYNKCGQESAVGEGIALLGSKIISVLHQMIGKKCKLLISPLSLL